MNSHFETFVEWKCCDLLSNFRFTFFDNNGTIFRAVCRIENVKFGVISYHLISL